MFQKISIPTPRRVLGNAMWGRGKGAL